YNGKASDDQKNNIRKEFKVYRVFGTGDKLVNSLTSAGSNKEKVEILLQAKQEMSEADFKAFMSKARQKITLESGNTSPILISNDLHEAYIKEKRKLPIDD
ncbi:MAG: hypothetical protein PHU71_06900, partial [Candidatus Gracilibacteria bacterium]|nr:hypothetical protein [Candidatus Gracilibacteria bacterium]